MAAGAAEFPLQPSRLVRHFRQAPRPQGGQSRMRHRMGADRRQIGCAARARNSAQSRQSVSTRARAVDPGAMAQTRDWPSCSLSRRPARNSRGESLEGGALFAAASVASRQFGAVDLEFDPVEAADRLLQLHPPQPGRAVGESRARCSNERRVMALQHRQAMSERRRESRRRRSARRRARPRLVAD